MSKYPKYPDKRFLADFKRGERQSPRKSPKDRDGTPRNDVNNNRGDNSFHRLARVTKGTPAKERLIIGFWRSLTKTM